MAKMKSAKPRNWWYELLVGIEMAAVVAPFPLFIRPAETGFLVGVAAWFAISGTARWMFGKHHMRGARAMKRGEYERAIGEFERSYDFFFRHPGIDKRRYLAMFRTSRFSYAEMALLNVGACNVRLERYAQARACYERLLRASPQNTVAAQMLAELDGAGV